MKNNLLGFTVCFLIFFNQIIYLAHMIFNFLGLSNDYTTELFLAVYVVLIFGSLLRFNYNINLKVLFVPFSLAVLFVISMLIYKEDSSYIYDNIAERMFLYALPTYILMSLVDDINDVMQYFKWFCIMSVITQTLAVASNLFFPQYFVETDYQGISYNLLIPALFFMNKEHKNIIEKVLVIFLVFLLTVAGGRGALVCVIFYVVYKGIISINRNVRQTLLVTAVLLVVFLFYGTIIDKIAAISEMYGFGGSIAKYYNSGNVFDSSGRDNIYIISLDIIPRFIFTGCGLGGDRYWLGVYGFKYGNYPHNFFLEILIQYGLFFGGGFIIYFLSRSIRCLFSKDKLSAGYKLFVIMFFSSGFMGLMFSTSYLVSTEFFAMLPLMAKIIKEKYHNGKSGYTDISQEY